MSSATGERRPDRPDERGATLAAVLGVLRRRLLVVVVCVLLGCTGGAAHTLLATAQYSSTGTVLLSLSGGQTANDLVQGSTYTQQLVQSYTRVATAPVVLSPVIQRLGLSTTPSALAHEVSATAPLNTALMDITVTDASPSRAASIAGAVVDQLMALVPALTPPGQPSRTVVVTTISPPAVPATPSSPHPRLDLAVGLLVGLLLGLAAALAVESWARPVTSRDDVAAVTDAPVIATVPRASLGRLLRRRSGPSSGGVRSEAHRVLRTNLLPLLESGPLVLVVSSARRREGRTATATGLAVALAEAGRRVLLVDADLRHPSLARRDGLDGSMGLTTVLGGGAGLDEAAEVWPEQRNLRVLCAGPVPPDPSELLTSAAMDDLLNAASQSYDAVILDSPPLLPFTDAAALAPRTDGLLLVVEARWTRSRDLAEAVDRCRGAGARVVGVVLNQVSKGPWRDQPAPPERQAVSRVAGHERPARA